MCVCVLIHIYVYTFVYLLAFHRLDIIVLSNICLQYAAYISFMVCFKIVL